MNQTNSSTLTKAVVEELSRLCKQQRTGTFLVLTAKHQMAQFGLRQGEIVALSFQNKECVEALDLLQKVEGSIRMARFIDGQPTDECPNLPPTEALLKILAGVSRTQPVAPLKTVVKIDLPDGTRKILEEELVEFMGPMGLILCEELWETGPSLHTAIETLSREIANTNQAEQFRQRVLQRLK